MKYLKEFFFFGSEEEKETERFIKDAIQAIESGEVSVKETGGGRAPFATRIHFLYNFIFRDKKVKVEKSVRTNKIDIIIDGEYCDLFYLVKKSLLKAVEEKSN
jgi:hypothetical protein